jgi:hypothetical protein
MSYDDWKLATPEDDAEDARRFRLRLLGRNPSRFLHQDERDDYWEECKADQDMDREDDD